MGNDPTPALPVRGEGLDAQITQSPAPSPRTGRAGVGSFLCERTEF
jgi:hypothetical protein